MGEREEEGWKGEKKNSPPSNWAKTRGSLALSLSPLESYYNHLAKHPHGIINLMHFGALARHWTLVKGGKEKEEGRAATFSAILPKEKNQEKSLQVMKGLSQKEIKLVMTGRPLNKARVML